MKNLTNQSKLFPILILLAFLLILASCQNKEATSSISFPKVQPDSANFNKPNEGEILTVSPPGFAWWRAAKKDKVSYLVHVFDKDGNEILVSPPQNDPVYVPSIVLEAGKYSWTVEALDDNGNVVDVRTKSSFEIAASSVELPWVDPAELLSRVSPSHPRLLFTEKELSAIRKELNTTFKESYGNIKGYADRALNLPLIEKPLWDTIMGEENYPAKRVAYREGYHVASKTYEQGVVPLALTYLLSKDKKYGEAAKAHLLNITNWSLDGSLQVQNSHFDEEGLTFARTVPEAYDWTYDLFSPEERVIMEDWMVALADSFMLRMESTDFQNYPSESHAGRVPAYLLEFAICLAERDEAVNWLDYSLKTALTVWPHWAGSGGGWAEGVHYALGYNERFIAPLHALKTATGYDLWQKPFFKKFPYFLIYCVSPVGEVTPFGDSEEFAVASKVDKMKGLFIYYSQINEDPGLRWWVNILSSSSAGAPEDALSNIKELIVRDNVEAVAPILPPDRVFPGIGWAAFHSDITDPENDLMLLFKSSPFGPASHSHADQNSFVIMKGGKALAIPGGSRYPQHGSPFHNEYTRQTEAHNAILINGKGQIERGSGLSGDIIDFKSSPHIGYAAGEANLAYGAPVENYVRHSIMIRPSLMLFVDEVVCSKVSSIDWLLQGKEEFILDEEKQELTSTRDDIKMKIQLFSEGGFKFNQTDEYPVDPKKDYPDYKRPVPENQWHFDAKLTEPTKESIIASFMSVEDGGKSPEIKTIRNEAEKTIAISVTFVDGDKSEILLNMGANLESNTNPLINIKYYPVGAEMEELTVKSIKD